MNVSTISTADFMPGGASQKNLAWLQAVATNPGIDGFDAITLAVELVQHADDTIFPSVQSIANEIDLEEKAVVAALWCLKESGHIDLQIDGSHFSARRLLDGGRL